MKKILCTVLTFSIIGGILYLLVVSSLCRWIIGISIIIFAIFIIHYFWKDMKEQEENTIKYLDECDEKLQKGEMTKEENDAIHFYQECGHNFA